MSTHPLHLYLEECRARHRTGSVTPETSYYVPFENLLNAVGQKLKRPRVRCFMTLKNVDGNMPDGGLFTPDQFPKGEDDPLPGQKPARGVIEAKPLKDDITKTPVDIGMNQLMSTLLDSLPRERGLPALFEF